MTQNQIDGARQIRDRSIPAIKLAAGAVTEFARDTATYTTTTLAEGAVDEGTIPLATGFRLLSIATSCPARIRLYTTGAKLTADAARPIGVDPSGDHGLILEYVTTAGCLTADLSPTVDGYSMTDPLSAHIPISVTQADTTPSAIVVTLGHIVTEA